MSQDGGGEPGAGGPAAEGPASLQELGAAVEQVFELFGDLRGQVETLADAVAPSGGGAVFRWAELDAEAARTSWTGLRQWVSWLLDRYAVKEVPRGCWWRHGLLVEELTGLWLAWQAAYGEKADATAPLIWHEHFDRARDRIRQRMQQQGNCSAGEHHEPVPQPYRDGEDEEFARFVDADVDARAPSSQPAPTPSVPAEAAG